MRRGVLISVLLVSLLLLPIIYVSATSYYKSPPYGNGNAWAYGTGGGGYLSHYRVDLSTGIQRLYISAYSAISPISAETHTTFNDNPVPGNSPVVTVFPGWKVRARVSGEAIGYINPQTGALGGIYIYSKLWRNNELKNEKYWKVESYSTPKMVQSYFIKYTNWIEESTFPADYTVTEETVVGITGNGYVDFYYLASSQQREVWVSTLGLEVGT